MQINGIGNGSTVPQKPNASGKKSENSGDVEQQIQQIRSEIDRLRQERANISVNGECRDEDGSHPEIAKAASKDVEAKMRAEIDQKIQRLQMKLQQLESQNTGKSKEDEQQNAKNENELLKSMGEVGQFVDEKL